MSKYHKTIKGVTVDVYDIIVAYGITCPAQQHALKKLLMPGQRGAKDFNKDMEEVIQSVKRSIEIHSGKGAVDRLDAEASDGRWTLWSGGDCPVPVYATIDVALRDGEVMLNCKSDLVNWSHDGRGCDVIAYRVLQKQ